MIRYVNLDFPIDPSPSVRRIAVKMDWTHSLVRISHSADFHEKKPTIVYLWKNANKSAKLSSVAMAREVNKWCEMRIRDRTTTKS